MPDDPQLARLLPLRPNDYHILFALLDGPRHGYAISQIIREHTRDQIRLEAANLQRTVQKLIRNGLVEESDWRPAPKEDDERRRYYALTDLGKRAVAADAARMRSVVDAAEAKQLLTDPRGARAGAGAGAR